MLVKSDYEIKGVPNLYAMEINPDEASAEYKERSLAPLRHLLRAEMNYFTGGEVPCSFFKGEI
ncbi:hypothetical protein [Desulfosporosinus fructosivorans]